MAFSNLPPQEKDAFFSLLDEYFTSRPDLLTRLASKNNAQPNNTYANSHPSPIHTAASAAHRAFTSNPPPAPKPAPSKPSPASQANILDEVADRVPAHATGRVAAAASAFSGAPAAPSPYHARTGSASGLTQQRKFGSDVDTSSAKGLYSSLRGSTASKNAPAPPVAAPPAFGRKQYGFAPPPARAHHTGSSGDDDGAPPPSPAPPPPPMPAQREEEGEWAEALYDYKSDEAGDLELQANQRVRVLERSSEDWWNGELEDGRRGLFPGSYVRLL